MRPSPGKAKAPRFMDMLARTALGVAPHVGGCRIFLWSSGVDARENNKNRTVRAHTETHSIIHLRAVRKLGELEARLCH